MGLQGLVHAGAITHIHHRRTHPQPLRLQGFQSSDQHIGLAVHGHHMKTILGQAFGNRQTDALGGACDKCIEGGVHISSVSG